eukprot:SAG11_NODE_38743_length_251_cov_0.631579_1_plen_49_part_01
MRWGLIFIRVYVQYILPTTPKKWPSNFFTYVARQVREVDRVDDVEVKDQ